MENELLEKGLAELRRARAAVEAMHEEFGSERAVVERVLEDAKCRLTAEIICQGGVQWEISCLITQVDLFRTVREKGGLHTHYMCFMHGEPEHRPLVKVAGAIEERVCDEELAALLTDARRKLRTSSPRNDLLAVRGRFFRFVGGKYEVVG